MREHEVQELGDEPEEEAPEAVPEESRRVSPASRRLKPWRKPGIRGPNLPLTSLRPDAPAPY